jgi:DJ-1/PfpI family
MNLLAKRLLFLVADGVDERDIEYLKKGLERESAEVFLTTAQPSLAVMTVANGRRGRDAYVDMPIEFADPSLYDALIIPNGPDSIDSICSDPLAVKAIRGFGEAGKPIILSGEADRVATMETFEGASFVREEGADSLLESAVDCIRDSAVRYDDAEEALKLEAYEIDTD